MAGIRSEVRIDAPGQCPIAQVSRETDASSHSISKSVSPESRDQVTEEFTLDSDRSIEDVGLEENVAHVFSYGSKDVYRFTREFGRDCACERIEQFDCPVVDVYTEDGGLYVTFHATDIEELRRVIGSLRDRHPNLSVEQLFRSRTETSEPELVVFDRTVLTDRQREVLETAHEMGYFEHPKDANAGEVADALDVTTSTFTEHLAAAQQKLLDAILDDSPASLSIDA